MDMLSIRAYCQGLKGTTEDYPFGPEPLVMKVGGKMYALLGTNDGVINLSLKCEPHMAELLRMQHEAIKPGYHLNKKHWNTVTIDGSLSDEELCEMMMHSYELVVRGLTKAQRAEFV
ncbi:MmcQ/YjbR family DNA-binding protein [Paenibacillus sp. strain BS8-2]